MYLYDRDDKTINVYELIGNKEKLAKYKKEELEKAISPEFRFLKAKTTNEKPLEDNCDITFWYKLESRETYYWSDDYFHFIEGYLLDEEEKLKQEEILNDYYEGKFSKNKVYEVQDYNVETSTFEVVKYLLPTRPYEIDEKNFFKVSVMNHILSIPKSLYLLQLIEQEKFYLVKDEDITKQLQLFDVSEKAIESFDLEKLKRADELNLLRNSYEDVLEKVEKSQKILTKVKR